MKIERLGRNDLKALEVGEIGIFTLPNAKAVEVGRVIASQLKKLEGMNFERIPWEELKEKYGNEYHTVIPDEGLTLAYRRIL